MFGTGVQRGTGWMGQSQNAKGDNRQHGNRAGESVQTLD